MIYSIVDIKDVKLRKKGGKVWLSPEMGKLVSKSSIVGLMLIEQNLFQVHTFLENCDLIKAR